MACPATDTVPTVSELLSYACKLRIMASFSCRLDTRMHLLERSADLEAMALMARIRDPASRKGTVRHWFQSRDDPAGPPPSPGGVNTP